ncbi:MAG: hypothetical protein VX679_04335 [Pseudomonadota bacterium]|nr:hypothetical protein [Pseudomonadota bacterium]
MLYHLVPSERLPNSLVNRENPNLRGFRRIRSLALYGEGKF